MPDNVMVFHKDFKSGEITAKPVGRIELATGTLRLFLLPDGLHATVSAKTMETRGLVVIPDYVNTLLIGESKVIPHG